VLALELEVGGVMRRRRRGAGQRADRTGGPSM